MEKHDRQNKTRIIRKSVLCILIVVVTLTAESRYSTGYFAENEDANGRDRTENVWNPAAYISGYLSDVAVHLTIILTEKIIIQPESISQTDMEGAEVSQVIEFVDVYGNVYQADIDMKVERHGYESDLFIHDGDRLSYMGEECSRRLGVDVSHHQGRIDWKKVKEAGIEFAMIRLGYRGYSEGILHLDREFERNIEEAHAAGLDVGVYFFSQAINEEEAVEEAEFVLEHLQGISLEMPVVYDPESILTAEARTDHITGEQFTKNTIVFCDMVEKAGYVPMVYSNMLWEAFVLDLNQLTDYDIWYADYEPEPQTPYHFSMWQYTNTGNVDGISGNVDLNIQLQVYE